MPTRIPARLLIFVFTFAFAALSVGCGGGDDNGAEGGAPATNASPNAAAVDAARLDAEIERLERNIERNPADDAVRESLASAYVKRGNLHRSGGRLAEALGDYEKALRTDPDNEDAMKNRAEVAPMVVGTPPPGEYGEPAPLPISPNVTDGEVSPTPTPRKQ